MSLQPQSKHYSYNIPLFRNCFKVCPSLYVNSQSYLVLKGQITDETFHNNKYVSPIYSYCNKPKQSSQSHIPLEGQCFYAFICSQKNQDKAVLDEDQIWNLIGCLSKAFIQLKKQDCAHKLTHFRQYNIRKIKERNSYKLLYHESMISNLEAALEGICQWSALYLSPQQLAEEKFVPQKSIIFSFGALLLNLCTNCDRSRTIYKKNKYQIDQKVIKYKIKIAQLKYGYSKTLTKFILRCLEMERPKRWNFVGLYKHLSSLSKENYFKHAKMIKNYFTQAQDQIIRQFDQYDEQDLQSLQQSDLMSRASQMSQQQSPRVFNYQRTYYDSRQKKLDQHDHKRSKSEDISLTIEINGFKMNSNYLQQTKNRNKDDDQINSYCQESERASQEQIKSLQQADKNYVVFKNRWQKQQQIQTPQKHKSRDAFNNELSAHNNNNKKQAKQINSKDMIPELKNQAKYRSCSYTGLGNYYEPELSKYPKSQQDIKYYSTSYPNNQQKRALNNQFIFKKHQSQVPKLIQSYKYLKLQDCLKQISELVIKINRVGIWAQGDIYYGDLHEGKRSGLGLQVYANGEYYYGFFRNDLYEGQGFYFWNKGHYFFGKFKNGKKINGLHYDQVIYQGQYKNNKRHGKGTCWYSTGQIYSGGWFEGKRHGQGFILQPNGPKFEGNWFEGERKGEGYLQNQNMRIIGLWNGQQVEGEALIQYKNGDKFKGQLNDKLQIKSGQFIKYRPVRERI